MPEKFFLSNLEIRRIYQENKSQASTKWMYDLYENLYFLVEKRSKKIKNSFKKEDFSQELSLSLWVAIKTFDCHKDFDFYRWLSWHISSCIRNFYRFNRQENSINLLISDTHQQGMPRQEILLLLKEILGDESILTERECSAVLEYFYYGKTLKEIGEVLCVSPERIRQIHHVSLEKIRGVVELDV